MQHKKKYQIFISSTFTDLKEERQGVQDVVLKMNHFPVGMELFSAANEDQWSMIEKIICNTDYYVLIIGYRYGSETEEGISYTQKEYTYAKEHSIPILAFIKKEGIPSTPDEREDSRAKQKKLRSFTEEVKNGRTVEWWSSKDELEKQVMNALYKEFDMHPRPGWIRADHGNTEEVQSELIEQNKRIRALEEENRRLRAQISERLPDFELFINDDSILSLKIPDWNEYSAIQAEYYPIDIEGRKARGASAELIKKYEKYNDSLPSEEILNQYISAKRRYDLSVNHATPVSFSIGNVGHSIASNVFIELTFPDSMIVYDKDGLEALTAPEKPPHAKNPDYEHLEHAMEMAAKLNKIYFPDPFASQSIKRIPTSLLLRSDGNTEYVEGHVLHIRRNQIMHTRCTVISDYYVVPLEAGEFEIGVNIICEELPEEKVFSFPVRVQNQ